MISKTRRLWKIWFFLFSVFLLAFLLAPGLSIFGGNSGAINNLDVLLIGLLILVPLFIACIVMTLVECNQILNSDDPPRFALFYATGLVVKENRKVVVSGWGIGIILAIMTMVAAIAFCWLLFFG